MRAVDLVKFNQVDRGTGNQSFKLQIFMTIKQITDQLITELKPLTFGLPVTHVYNPLLYSRPSYNEYFERYGNGNKEVLLIGMNPGPFGMAQTGVPFGEVAAVRDWLGIEKPVVGPVNPHPKRPVQGFLCQRSEVSGRRVWGWAKARFGTPRLFFERFLVINYCPLVFIEESGRNRTPDKLAKTERESLYLACDKALRKTVQLYRPRWVIGVGSFAEKRAAESLAGLGIRIGRITHPSPANPKANAGWSERIEQELELLGIDWKQA
jgi:single-strand selective monofunctional uracil DNA glycosylase